MESEKGRVIGLGQSKGYSLFGPSRATSLLLVGSSPALHFRCLPSFGRAAIRDHIYLFHMKVRALPSGRCFRRREKTAVKRYGVPQVRSEVLGTRQPDGFAVFAFQRVLAIIEPNAALDCLVALVR